MMSPEQMTTSEVWRAVAEVIAIAIAIATVTASVAVTIGIFFGPRIAKWMAKRIIDAQPKEGPHRD